MPNQYLPPVITIPSALEISAMSQAVNMVVTVAADSDQVNTYLIGQLVRVTVPYSFKMWQANGSVGRVINVTGNMITLDIDSRYFDSFSNPNDGSGPASLAPFGSQNLAFDNTTAQEPFQSLNNSGN